MKVVVFLIGISVFQCWAQADGYGFLRGIDIPLILKRLIETDAKTLPDTLKARIKDAKIIRYHQRICSQPVTNKKECVDKINEDTPSDKDEAVKLLGKTLLLSDKIKNIKLLNKRAKKNKGNELKETGTNEQATKSAENSNIQDLKGVKIKDSKEIRNEKEILAFHAIRGRH